MSTDSSPFAYDAVAYPTQPQPQIHPERLAALGTLHGLDPVPIGESRILELGCGDAGNLAPIAAAFPGSRCTGLDLSRAAIERGRDFARRCGLKNLELHHADIATPGALRGEFDYIVCHGLYAWVPEAAREGILRLCGEQLAPHGVAMVSFNALPGAGIRQEIRQMLRWHVRQMTDPSERLQEARALVEFLARATLDTDEIRRGFRAELQVARDKDPGFLFHDELSEHYAPLYFHEFMSAAGRHALRFVADADPAELALLSLPTETRHIVAALTDDRIEQQQYLDFLIARRFRHTLLCRADRTVSPEILLDRVPRCWFSAQGRLANPEKVSEPGGVAVFERPGGLKLETDFLPGKFALQRLVENGPSRIAFADLARHAQAQITALHAADAWTDRTPVDLARFLLEACTPRVATLHGAVPDISPFPADRPLAFPVARVQATASSTVTSAYHLIVRLEDRWSREIVARADGTRTQAQLISELDALAAACDPSEADVWRSARAGLPGILGRLAQQGLMIA